MVGHMGHRVLSAEGTQPLQPWIGRLCWGWTLSWYYRLLVSQVPVSKPNEPIGSPRPLLDLEFQLQSSVPSPNLTGEQASPLVTKST